MYNLVLRGFFFRGGELGCDLEVNLFNDGSILFYVDGFKMGFGFLPKDVWSGHDVCESTVPI